LTKLLGFPMMQTGLVGIPWGFLPQVSCVVPMPFLL
jgi:hypothetical protein